ncbi:MAG: hypothetical protein ABS910_11390 [Arthrobacter sp.]
MENSQGRREQRQQRAFQRRRNRMKAGAVAALGGIMVLGTAGTAVGEEDLRATAGIQLASLALPLFTDAPVPAANPSPSAAPAAGGADTAAETAPARDAGQQAPGAQASDAGQAAAAAAAAETEAQAAAAREAEAAAAAAEQAAAERAAAEKAAAEQAAAEEAARVAAASVPVDDPAGAKAYAASVLGSHGWEASQMTCLDTLWNKESEWLTSATNASSGAYGIPQALPGTKLATAGGDWQTNYRTQINWGLSYIESRYGSPCSALNFHYANNWY